MRTNPFALRDYNPLRGLDEARLASMLDQAERGAWAELQWLYRYIEKRNPAARASKRRLLSAIGRLKWDIKRADTRGDAAREAQAEAQAATLRAAYDRIANLHAALQHLASAELRGFAHLEKIYARGADGAAPSTAAPGAPGDPASIVELRLIPQWHWVRDGFGAPWEYNERATMGAWRGAAIDPANFVIREIDDPAMEIVAKLHVRQDVSDADWDGYLQRFGIPATIIEGPPNVPPEKEREYQAMAEKIASDAAGYIPNGASVHSVAPGTGSSVFKERLEYLDAQIVIAATSGKLNVLTESGSGTLAGGAQKEAFDEIAAAIAADISGVMQAQFDAPLLAQTHPGEEVLAYFEFSPVDEKDAGRVLADAKTAQEAGYEIDAAELSEKSGYKLTRAAAADASGSVGTPPAGSGRMPERSPADVQLPAAAEKPPAQEPFGAPPAPAAGTPALPETIPAALGVTPEYLAPAAEALQQLIADAQDGGLSDGELIARAEDLLAALPGLARRMDATGVADALEQAMRMSAEAALQPA